MEQPLLFFVYLSFNWYEIALVFPHLPSSREDFVPLLPLLLSGRYRAQPRFNMLTLRGKRTLADHRFCCSPTTRLPPSPSPSLLEQAKGIKPTEVTYATAIGACARATTNVKANAQKVRFWVARRPDSTTFRRSNGSRRRRGLIASDRRLQVPARMFDGHVFSIRRQIGRAFCMPFSSRHPRVVRFNRDAHRQVVLSTSSKRVLSPRAPSASFTPIEVCVFIQISRS